MQWSKRGSLHVPQFRGAETGTLDEDRYRKRHACKQSYVSNLEELFVYEVGQVALETKQAFAGMLVIFRIPPLLAVRNSPSEIDCPTRGARLPTVYKSAVACSSSFVNN